jgi:aspartyl protease family protein
MMDSDTWFRVVYLVVILASLAGWIVVEFRQRMGQALRMALAWGLIFIGVMAGYGLWYDVQRQTTQVQTVTDTGMIEVPRSADGHYYLTLTINGTELPFMVDTGASGLVLSLPDAEHLGIDPESLAFLGEASTANGFVRTAMVTLPLIELGDFRNENFRAYVTEGEMEGSLLGMDYLGQFRIEVAGDRMTLRH